ncbi:hypothetical protein BU17DRAFT_67664 [Hysterangium stoloniferum]|nr:hypothetical protein BU17DRAFT_67664 [Hysterangium stoloniferum]
MTIGKKGQYVTKDNRNTLKEEGEERIPVRKNSGGEEPEEESVTARVVVFMIRSSSTLVSAKPSRKSMPEWKSKNPLPTYGLMSIIAQSTPEASTGSNHHTVHLYLGQQLDKNGLSHFLGDLP